MTGRRDFIKKAGLLAGGIFMAPVIKTPVLADNDPVFQSRRPDPAARNFNSTAVESTIEEIKSFIPDKELGWMFENCFPNTLDTTVTFREIEGKPDTFVITGDIHAMWLRDSSAQVWPYLTLVNEDPELKNLIAGVINRQTRCILTDPYANAFNDGPTGSEWEKDLTDMKPELHERKWEIDSLCYPVRLAYNFWKKTGDVSCFDAEWVKAAKLIYRTFIEQQRKENRGPYKFQRVTAVQTDTVALGGYGNPVKPVGLICSIFRPSDDSTIFPFLIPSNLFAVKSLRQLSEIFSEVIKDYSFSENLSALADEVEAAVMEYGVAEHKKFGKIFAFEADGFGNRLFMDDSNVPGLLSMPYLNLIDKENEIYQNTRRFLLSEENPYFHKGKYAEGIGGPHVGLDMIWPMSIIMRGMTSEDPDEILYCLRTLIKTHAGTGFMHEAFHKDDPAIFTRKWFAWANTLFGEFILKIYRDKPEILLKV